MKKHTKLSTIQKVVIAWACLLLSMAFILAIILIINLINLITTT